jgi:hypothetical protein
MSALSKKRRGICSAELRPASHRRAKHAAFLSRTKLIDFLSDAADCRSRRVLKKHGVAPDFGDDVMPVSQGQ